MPIASSTNKTSHRATLVDISQQSQTGQHDMARVVSAQKAPLGGVLLAFECHRERWSGTGIDAEAIRLARSPTGIKTRT